MMVDSLCSGEDINWWLDVMMFSIFQSCFGEDDDVDDDANDVDDCRGSHKQPVPL
jgi:hypothetical protein